ncbi:MAG: response regulator transcription factor [Archangium sp.]|nr:response regulator transcription factor [Archangium sp.]
MPAPIRRLLVIDDDAALTSVLVSFLEEEGYSVATAVNGLEGLKRFKAEPPDLVVLDVLMPEMDGLEVCRRIRAQSRVPIILLTSRNDEVDRVTGLETGADDYVTKPFSLRELGARIRAIGRRLEAPATLEIAPSSDRVEVGALVVDLARFEVQWSGTRVELTRSELLVLAALARRPGFALSRDRLLDLAKGDETVVTERTVDTFIKRIRKKLNAAGRAFDEIETVIGVGYRYRAPE